jgi:hypothetical protein
LEEGRLDVNVHVFPGVSSLSNTFNKKYLYQNKGQGERRHARAQADKERIEIEGMTPRLVTWNARRDDLHKKRCNSQILYRERRGGADTVMAGEEGTTSTASGSTKDAEGQAADAVATRTDARIKARAMNDFSISRKEWKASGASGLQTR